MSTAVNATVGTVSETNKCKFVECGNCFTRKLRSTTFMSVALSEI